MKSFLNDYGLVWVGQPTQPEAEQACCSATCGAGKPSAAAEAPAAAGGGGGDAAAAQLPFDVSELRECLDELNQLAGDGISQLKQLESPAAARTAASPNSSSRGRAMQLVTPEPVKLAIFRDGLVLHQCPPLPYSSEAADGILSDIFDGYFPSALKGEFPDGIPIQLMDRSAQTLAEAAAVAAAAAQKGSNIIGWQDLEQQQQRGLSGLAASSGQAFLERLPKTVIRNQQVVSVRPAVEQFINGSTSSSGGSGAAGKIYIRPSSCSGALSRAASQGAAAAAAAAAGQQNIPAAVNVGVPPPQQQQQQATMQVKSEDGKQTYVLVLPYTATIAALRASIDKHRASTGASCMVCQQQQQQQQPAAAKDPNRSTSIPGNREEAVHNGTACRQSAGVCCSYELRSAFPARLYADVSSSLEQAGLVPSATLFMRHTAGSAV
jgi:hypothetical protein